MSSTTKDINRVTGAIIKVSLRLIIYALVILILYEGVTIGYEFGHEIFASTAVSPAPGTDKTIVVEDGRSSLQVGKQLEEEGLIRNGYAFWIQSMFYEYDIYPGAYVLNTSMTSKEMLEVLSVKPEKTEEAPGS